MSRSTFVKLALLAPSLLVSLVIVEVGVALLRPQDLSGSWRVQTESGLEVNRSAGSARHQFGSRVVRYEFSEPNLRNS